MRRVIFMRAGEHSASSMLELITRNKLKSCIDGRILDDGMSVFDARVGTLGPQVHLKWTVGISVGIRDEGARNLVRKGVRFRAAV